MCNITRQDITRAMIQEKNLHQPWTLYLQSDIGNAAASDPETVKCMFVFDPAPCLFWKDLSHRTHSVFSVVSPPRCVCVLNTMTLLLREGLTRSGRYGSSTSPAGLTTVCPITPQACWDLLGESSPRPWTTLGPWWFTAGQRTWADRSYIYAPYLCWQVFNDFVQKSLSVYNTGCDSLRLFC